MKGKNSKVYMSLEAKNRPIADQPVTKSQPADATHRTTKVKESARKAYSTGY